MLMAIPSLRQKLSSHHHLLGSGSPGSTRPAPQNKLWPPMPPFPCQWPCLLLLPPLLLLLVLECLVLHCCICLNFWSSTAGVPRGRDLCALCLFVDELEAPISPNFLNGESSHVLILKCFVTREFRTRAVSISEFNERIARVGVLARVHFYLRTWRQQA